MHKNTTNIDFVFVIRSISLLQTFFALFICNASHKIHPCFPCDTAQNEFISGNKVWVETFLGRLRPKGIYMSQKYCWNLESEEIYFKFFLSFSHLHLSWHSLQTADQNCFFRTQNCMYSIGLGITEKRLEVQAHCWAKIRESTLISFFWPGGWNREMQKTRIWTETRRAVTSAMLAIHWLWTAHNRNHCYFVKFYRNLLISCLLQILHLCGRHVVKPVFGTSLIETEMIL